MDKYEYRVKTEQMLEYMNDRAYDKAMEIAESIDWRKVKNISMLNSVSEIYELNGEYQKSREILFLAYDRSPSSRKVVYRLGTLALKLKDVSEALDCYEEFLSIAPKDPNQYILHYKILKAQKAPIEQQIEALEAFKKAEYVEKWAYELAKLYKLAGRTAECLEECDDLILWFSEGKYVYKAMELKMQYKPLTPLQQEKYEHRFDGGRRAEKIEMPKDNIEEKLESMAQEELEYVEDEVEDVAFSRTVEIPAEKIQTALNEERKEEKDAEEKADSTVDEVDIRQETEEETRSVKAPQQEKESKGAAAVGVTAGTLAGMVSGAAAEGIAETVKAKTEARVRAKNMKVRRPKTVSPEIEKVLEESKDTPDTVSADSKVEDKISGQMKIEDILQGWEEKQKQVLKEIEEKRKKSEEEALNKAKESVEEQPSLLSEELQKLMDELENGESGDAAYDSWETEEKEKDEKTGETEQVENMGDLVEELKISHVEEEVEEKEGLEEDSEEFEDFDSFEEEEDFEGELELPEEIQEEEETVQGETVQKQETFSQEKSIQKEELEETKEELIEETLEIEEPAEQMKAGEDLDATIELKDIHMKSEEDQEELDEFWDESEEPYEESDESEWEEGEDLTDEELVETNFEEEEKANEISGKEEQADQEEPIEYDEPDPIIKRSPGGVVYDTGFVVQGRYDLDAQSEVGLKAGLTQEQKKLFSYFVPVRGMSEQLVDVLDADKKCKNRYGTSRTGNLLIIGRKGSGKTVLAVDVVKAIQKQRKMKQGKVAIITGESLNKKDLNTIVQKLYGGALIVEKASKIDQRTLEELNELMEGQTGEMLIVLEEQRKPMEDLLSRNLRFKKKFTSCLELPVFINDELVTFGQTYAKENGYRIDEMGILALYSRIDMMQKEDHIVTVAEVKEVMDDAIAHSQKANMKHFVKRVFGRSTDDTNRIILKEEDFKI